MSNALNLILEEIKQELDTIISKVNKKCLNKADELNVIYEVYNGLKEIDLQLKEVKKNVSYIEYIEDSIKVVLRTKSLSSISFKELKDENDDGEMNIEKIEVANNKSVNAISISSIDFNTPFINCPLYYCKSTRKFHLKINGHLLSGGLVNIYDNKDKNPTGILKCKWQNLESCKEHRKYIKCKYFHDDDTRNYTWDLLRKTILSKKDINISTIFSKDEKKILGSLIIHCLLMLQL